MKTTTGNRTIIMGTLGGFPLRGLRSCTPCHPTPGAARPASPNPPALVRAERSSAAPHAIFAIALAACLGSASPLWAQGGQEEGHGADGWVPVKHLEFTDEDVQGGYFGPDGELIHATQRAVQPSLIEIRRGFEAEMVKTLENL